MATPDITTEKKEHDFSHGQLRTMLGEIASIAAKIDRLTIEAISTMTTDNGRESELVETARILANVIGGIADEGEGMAQRGDLLEWVLPPSFKPSEATT